MGKDMKKLLLIPVVAAILFLMINTDIISIFTASHSLTNISQPGNQISCETCHSQIQRELNNSTYHRDLTCEACHRYNASITFASDNGVVQPGNESHAAYLPRCLDCHGGNGVYIYNKTNSLVYAPPAKAFNLTNYGSNYSAHKKFVIDSNNFSAAKGENEACLSCHTGFDINLTFQYPEYINWTLKTEANANVVDKYYANYTPLSYELGPNRAYTVSLIRDGGKHTWINVSNISCIECHKNIYLGSYGYYNTSVSAWVRQHAGDVEDKGNDPALHQTYHPPDNAYCLDCHKNINYTSYPNLHPDEVHAAEKLTCVTCHSDGGPWPPSNETMESGGHNSPDFYQKVSSFPRSIIGDMCISCHVANNHALEVIKAACHNPGTKIYYINSTAYREPKANETGPGWLSRVISEV
jgi:nitrate/TMAO reductase-like tetraheme cytochrome c subunit